MDKETLFAWLDEYFETRKNPELPERLTVEQVAQMSGHTPSTIRSFVWHKKIPYRKIAGVKAIIFDRKEIENWIKTR